MVCNDWRNFQNWGPVFIFLPQNLSYEEEGHPMDLSIFRHPIILTVEPIIIVRGFYPTDGGLTGHIHTHLSFHEFPGSTLLRLHKTMSNELCPVMMFNKSF